MDSKDYIKSLEQQNAQLLARIESLTKQVENLTEILLQMRKDEKR